ncbi:Ig-like domain-containing protein [Blautia sp. Sow4_E7]|uniref:Ig-like domain-containing protein n=1 Tax=Blautia sp. Sow4_E7 TaxID=3438749 RepID=UPI003F90A029
MKKIFKSIITIMLVLSVMVCGTNSTVYAATKSISVKTNKSTLYILDSANNKAKLTVTYNGKNVTKAAKHKSSNSKIAKVNKNGVITAVRPGTVKITTKYKGKSRTTKVTIKKAKLSLNKKTIELSRGQKFTLKAFANKSGISNRNIKWTSSNSKVASINKNGIITTKKNGTTTISCKTAIGKVSAKVIVKNNSDNASTQENSGHTHHWVTVEDTETIPAVTKWQIKCLGCNQYYDTHTDLDNHAMKVQLGLEPGNPERCGSCAADAEREIVITPAKTIITGTHEECDICHARR